MAFNLENYEPVADRLARAHADHPDLRVITDLVHVQRSEDGRPIQYIVRAQIYIGDVLKAQDFAEETVGSSPVNRTSALENCSTSAIGRALADFNYQTKIEGKAQRPSREEMEKVARADVKITYTDEQINLATEAHSQIADISTMAELKLFYTGANEAGILAVPVDGKTLNQLISARKKELEKADA